MFEIALWPSQPAQRHVHEVASIVISEGVAAAGEGKVFRRQSSRACSLFLEDSNCVAVRLRRAFSCQFKFRGGRPFASHQQLEEGHGVNYRQQLICLVIKRISETFRC